MNVEMEALGKNKTWELLDFMQEKRQWDVSGFILLNIEWMGH